MQIYTHDVETPRLDYIFTWQDMHNQDQACIDDQELDDMFPSSLKAAALAAVARTQLSNIPKVGFLRCAQHGDHEYQYI